MRGPLSIGPHSLSLSITRNHGSSPDHGREKSVDSGQTASRCWRVPWAGSRGCTRTADASPYTAVSICLASRAPWRRACRSAPREGRQLTPHGALRPAVARRCSGDALRDGHFADQAHHTFVHAWRRACRLAPSSATASSRTRLASRRELGGTRSRTSGRRRRRTRRSGRWCSSPSGARAMTPSKSRGACCRC